MSQVLPNIVELHTVEAVGFEQTVVRSAPAGNWCSCVVGRTNDTPGGRQTEDGLMRPISGYLEWPTDPSRLVYLSVLFRE